MIAFFDNKVFADGYVGKGRGRCHIFEEASRVIPEVLDHDCIYLEHTMKMPDSGELKV